MQYNSARGAIEAEETERALEAAYAEAEGGEGGWEEGQQPGGHGAGDGWLEDGRPQHAHQAAQQGQRWLEFAEDDEDDDGPTLAVPEQAPKQKRSGGRGGGGASDGRSGGGGKRQRQEQEQQEPSGWVEVPHLLLSLHM
ncbi:putative G-coupled receptor 101 [Micractinium conductrix]|uniref:G-coupled receptor 101 n=1 Tax=Micractinium conductrix TaxID=554055 RepID=A0A2P6V9L7_9CHLO|nr:putative G-coupled receptor 101 [Micractinium conductrix]|eukprot:PSC70782.1 putative G-coupled receptor 101 [Micractinium conductrix]